MPSLVVKHTDRVILKDLKWRIDKEEMLSSQTARVSEIFNVDRLGRLSLTSYRRI
jgi:hypothetical protein